MVKQRRGVDAAPDPAAPTTFGRLLRRYRGERGLTQEQLAEQSGISVRAIGALERSIKHKPRDATVALLADALQLSGAQRATLVASMAQGGRTTGGGHPHTGTRLPLVPVHPTYPLPRAGPFVGREEILNRVLNIFPHGDARSDGVRGHDRPRLLLIVGDAGMGKTRLLAEMAQQAQEQGLLVLAGGSYEAEGRLPLGAVHDALLDYIAAQVDEVLQVQFGGLLPDLSCVVPELRDRFPDLPDRPLTPLEDHRPRLFWTLSRVLERISAAQPLVLLLDDLQWADATTLQFMHVLTRQPQLDHLLVVGAYRPDATSTSGDSDHLLAKGTREPSVRHIDLQPIDQTGLAAVLGVRLGGVCTPELARAVHARSGGNPFFALEIVGLLHQKGQLERDRDATAPVWALKEGRGGELPRAVRDTVAQRLTGLDREVVALLHLAAVVGRQVRYMTLTDLWEGGERPLLRALDSAIAARILEETERGYAFRHPLLQEVVYGHLSAAHRAWLHARVAQSLEAMYGPRAEEHASELAHHLVAGGTDEARALHYLTLAADASVRAAAWPEALTAYQTALSYARGDHAVAALQERIGGVLQALGRYDEALVACEDAVARYERVGDLPRLGAVTAVLVQVHALQGSWAQGRAWGTRVMGQIEGLSPGTTALSRALADLYLAVTYLYDVGLEQRLQDAERAAALARALGDNGRLARAEMRRSLMLYALHRFSQAQAAIEALLPVAAGLGDSTTLRFAVDIRADIHKLAGRFEACRRDRERALAYAEERPEEPHWIMVSRAQLAEARFLLGDWAGARVLYEQAVQMSHSYPTPHYAAFALLGLAMLDLAEGRWAEATQLIATCLAEAQRTHDRHWVRNAQRLLAHHDLVRGRPEDAFRQLADDGEEHPGTLSLRAWGYLATGDIQRAATTSDHAVALARERENHLDLCEAWIVRGAVCARQGCIEDAERAFGAAVALARSMPHPYAEARTLYEWGLLDRQRGAHKRSRGHLAEAAVILRRLGAQPYLDRIHQVRTALPST